METELAQFPAYLLQNLNVVYTFFLLVTRYVGLFILVPGIGGGQHGLIVRFPGILVLSFASMYSSPRCELPSDMVVMMAQMSSELLLGLFVGMIPLLVVSGVHMAGQLASMSMGLGAAQLMDPNLGVAVSDIARMYGDIIILMFLLMGGHHLVIQVVSGYSGSFVPGTFFLTASTIDVLISRTAHTFFVGVMLSAPVVVALLLTQFVMGMMSKTVPTINIFIISFPLTIGIGMILTVMGLHGVSTYMQREIVSIEAGISAGVLGAVK